MKTNFPRRKLLYYFAILIVGYRVLFLGQGLPVFSLIVLLMFLLICAVDIIHLVIVIRNVRRLPSSQGYKGNKHE